MNWPQDAIKVLQSEPACVRVVVLQARGSTPREAGAGMIVGLKGFTGSIGGGTLEFDALHNARRMLSENADRQVMTETLALGPSLGQCCGGSVTLGYALLGRNDVAGLEQASRPDQIVMWRREAGSSFDLINSGEAPVDGNLREVVRRLKRKTAPYKCKPDSTYYWIEASPAPRSKLVLFGAGHVGREIVRILSASELDIDWVDQRASEFPAAIPQNATAVVHTAPAQFAASMPSSTNFLVLTHDHKLDLEICNAILGRNNFSYLGLIGSQTKSTRFRKRLLELGHPAEEVDRLICPIGHKGGSKKPFDVALQICAHLLSP